MSRAARIFSAIVLSVLVTLLCAISGPFLIVGYALGGVWRGVREVAVAWWAFARLPWAA